MREVLTLDLGYDKNTHIALLVPESEADICSFDSRKPGSSAYTSAVLPSRSPHISCHPWLMLVRQPALHTCLAHCIDPTDKGVCGGMRENQQAPATLQPLPTPTTITTAATPTIPHTPHRSSIFSHLRFASLSSGMVTAVCSFLYYCCPSHKD
jgi:hypothetical protein